MHDIRPDENGRNRFIEIVQNVQSLFCAGVAPLHTGFDFNLAHRCKGRFRHRKIRSEKEQHNNNQPWQSTAIIHEGYSRSSFVFTEFFTL